MKPGTESQTAVMVCMARAMAHGRSTVAKFEDPTALVLLPPEARLRVERLRSGTAPRRREVVQRAIVEARSKMMVVRTVTVDEAIRHAENPQVVILGAGLDGRAWRMPELRDVTVFEVDHPDSQRSKRERAAALEGGARDVRFVGVDFERDDLDAALRAAGHDSDRPTTWVWEGVVMYLERRDIEDTLAIVQRRSAPRSRLIVVYNAPNWKVRIIGLLLHRVGEPFRSSFTAPQMRALLAQYGFEVAADHDIPSLAAELDPDLVADLQRMRHARVVVASAVDAA